MKPLFSSRSTTIRARIALAIFAASSGALILLALAVYFGLSKSLLDNFDDSLRTQATSESKFIDTSGGDPKLTLSGPGDDLSTDDAGFVQLFGRDGALIVSDEDFAIGDAEKRMVSQALAGRTALEDLRIAGFAVRVYASPVLRGDQVIGALVVGGRQDSVEKNLSRLRELLLLFVPATSALVAIIAFYIARRTLQPIREITLAADSIAKGDLSQRIEEGASHDEVGELATTFNRMIARLEETIERERRFTGDASHELRTPLTAMDAALEVTLSQERTAEQYRNVLVSLHKRTTQMMRMARQLLLLSRMDAGDVGRNFRPVNLTELLSTVVEAFGDEHPEVDVKFTQDGATSITGDSELLARAFTNVLENALVHAPGAAITVTSGREGGFAYVSFADQGPGIPPEQLPNVLRRFDRGAAPQERAGAGLGLAIVDFIVQAHHGRVTIENQPVGVKVTLYFPSSGSQPTPAS